MSSEPKPWPPAERDVQEVHDRYQREVVEGLGVCPFARRARERDLVKRPVIPVVGTSPSAAEVAEVFRETLARHPDVEIVLLTFPTPPEHALNDPDSFEALLRDIREATAEVRPVFYMVSFHPELQPPRGRPLTRETFVSLLRRSPDPVIQCVRASVLDDLRRQAQQSAHKRLHEQLHEIDPKLAEMLHGSIQADPELSADIAEQNFKNLADGDGRARLEEKIAELRRARRRLYPGD